VSSRARDEEVAPIVFSDLESRLASAAMAQRLAVLLAVVLSGGAAAGTKVIKNDTFTGAGGIFAGVSFGEYQGAGVLFEGEPGDYPMKIVAVDILAVPYQQQGTGVGAYLIDLYDEAEGLHLRGARPAPRRRAGAGAAASSPSLRAAPRRTSRGPKGVSRREVDYPRQLHAHLPARPTRVACGTPVACRLQRDRPRPDSGLRL
jgi:hypothetical protein